MGTINRAISTPCLDLGGRYMAVCSVFIHSVYLCLMKFLWEWHFTIRVVKNYFREFREFLNLLSFGRDNPTLSAHCEKCKQGKKRIYIKEQLNLHSHFHQIFNFVDKIPCNSALINFPDHEGGNQSLFWECSLCVFDSVSLLRVSTANVYIRNKSLWSAL